MTSAPALRWVLDPEGFAVGAVLAGILAGTGCRVTVVSSLTGVAPTSGGTLSAGAGATSGGGRSSTGGTGGGASAGGGSTTGPALCGPGETWAGDSCVAQQCADFANFPCLLVDGGLGVCVSGACLDLDSDPSNCGTYGRKCPPDTVCFEGLCILHDGGLAPCEPPYIPQLYPTSFGETDGPCALETCAANSDSQICVLPGTNDELVGFCCGGGCISSDVGNCGGCGIVCGAGSVCNEDLWEGCEPWVDCATSPTEAPCRFDGGLQGNCCEQTCVDLDSDPRNCAYCGIVVPLGQTCVGGIFAPICMDAGCPPGSSCDPNDGECVVSAQCSARRQGESCLMAGGVGVCCGDTCVPSFLACGQGPGCHLCDAGQECDSVCTVSSPTEDCQFGPNQAGLLCGQQCVAYWEDPQNCGACGNVCPSGVCSPQPLTCLPEAPTDDCLVSCGPSAVCFEGTCMESDCASLIVPFCLAENGTIGLCCGHACAHPLDDPENCGGCGNTCPPGQACVDGACSGFAGCGPSQMYGFCDLDAGSSHACCPSTGCTDLMTDPLNCGRCGSSCSEVLNCVDGFCVVPQDAGIGGH